MVKGEKPVPNTILDEIIGQTISNLNLKPEFNEESVEYLESLLKTGKADPDKIIKILKGS
ncbi:hypothetical protein [Methanobacterium alcaliphilum]|uniref:hypothetical protein n=1 Tax=Methanobacterium alcaliphilum TaxID=392018 RepID=UPI00200A685C|nr:hypothetical protein [Methanobacterium alcaliphilum]MCK9151818.1 hypothetical protein [Methanobacterium alcaliphilum]